MREIILILNNIRSTYNVGSIIRTAECLGVKKIYSSGYTPYTLSEEILDPPHIRSKMLKAISKTSLGAEIKLPAIKNTNIIDLLFKLKSRGYTICALEQDQNSIPIVNYKLDKSTVIILGEEVKGLPADILSKTEIILEIPMLGAKESYNVSVACGIALYELRRSEFIAQ